MSAKRPNKVKAVAIFALLGVFASLAGSLFIGVPARMILTRLVPPDDLGLPLLVVSIITQLTSFALLFAIVDRVPVGRHRLRFIPKDDPIPEIFS